MWNIIELNVMALARKKVGWDFMYLVFVKKTVQAGEE